MDKNYEKVYHKVEHKGFWFKARRDIIYDLMKHEHNECKILDIGCSGGVLIDFLKKKGYSNVEGMETSKEARLICKKKKIKIHTTINHIKSNTYDIVIASDVLEHIKDSHKALKEWKRILKPYGLLIVFVPAYRFLWGWHDIYNEHKIRYTKGSLIEAFNKAGIIVLRSSYWNSMLLFPRVISTSMDNSKITYYERMNTKPDYNPSDVKPIPNLLLFSWLKFENRLLKYINFPFGISVFAIGTKRWKK